jgi:hypothetical protein
MYVEPYLLKLLFKVHHLGWCKRKLFECPDCYRSFENKKAMDIHRESIHLGIRTVCPLCDKPVTRLGRSSLQSADCEATCRSVNKCLWIFAPQGHPSIQLIVKLPGIVLISVSGFLLHKVIPPFS